jgi:hypothetical protein
VDVSYLDSRSCVYRGHQNPDFIKFSNPYLRSDFIRNSHLLFVPHHFIRSRIYIRNCQIHHHVNEIHWISSNSIRHHKKEIHQISSNLLIAAFNQISSNSDLRPEPSLSLIFQISSKSAIVAFNQISSNSDLHPRAFITSDYAGGLQN